MTVSDLPERASSQLNPDLVETPGMSKNTTTATVIPFPGAPAPMPSNALPAELRDDLDWQVKFLNRVEPVDRDDPNSCRLWQGSRSKSGYGTVRHGRRVLYADRVGGVPGGGRCSAGPGSPPRGPLRFEALL